jgi:methylmalonyl-CoA mutase cobalamin-binding domain/chain
MPDLHVPVNPVRLVTASSLFDGHDASINIMRRILQSQGAEVVHLGHNRSVQEVVDAAIEEDVQGVAVSSYQGGHVEYFEYLVSSLAERGAGHIKVFGGGGGVIVAEEIARLRESGVTIFSPEDGQRLGLVGMINEIIKICDVDLWQDAPASVDAVLAGDRTAIARAITGAEVGELVPVDAGALEHRGVEPRGGLLRHPASGVGDRGEHLAAVVGVAGTPDEPLLLQPVDGTGDARRVHLEQRPHPGHRQLAAGREREQHEDLVARERQVARAEHRVDPLHEQLLDPHDRGDQRHPVGGLRPAVRHPLPASLADRVLPGRRWRHVPGP